MDLAQMKAAVTMEGVLSGTAALELIAEVERLISLCAEYRGEVDPLKDRITALECEVEESRALCDGYRGEIEQLKKDYNAIEKRESAAWSQVHSLQSALTRAEGMEEAANVAYPILLHHLPPHKAQCVTAAIRARAAKGDSDEG